MQVVARFKNDDQLAAVLADGVAFNLQRQAARIVEANRVLLGAEAASLTAAAFIPLVGLPDLIAGNLAASKIQTEMEEQRGRVALELMATAGYDPWQAPEAWRLAAPKELSTDLSSLTYPDRSGYQFAILNHTYRKSLTSQAAESASAADSSTSGKP
jgi:hypothetical protein